MQQFLVQIENESHIKDFLSYMKSIGEDHIQKLENDNIHFTKKEKQILDERRDTSDSKDYLPWDEAIKGIKF